MNFENVLKLEGGRGRGLFFASEISGFPNRFAFFVQSLLAGKYASDEVPTTVNQHMHSSGC